MAPKGPALVGVVLAVGVGIALADARAALEAIG